MNSRSVIVTVTVLTLTLLIQSCNRPDRMSRKAGEHITTVIQASAETDPTLQGKNVDSADDPAIWINRESIENSVIIGTDKKGGLATYDLAGKQLHY